MFIQLLLPILKCAFAFIIPYLKQRLDNKFTGNPYITKSTSIEEYKKKYGGNNYMIHFKYSDALNITYVSLLFGLGMPLLFPMAVLTLRSQQLFEKMTIAWVARLPPAMDN